MIRIITSAIVCLLICLATLSAPVFAWVISADFEDGAVGSNAQLPNTDAFFGAANDSKYVDSPVLTGNQAGSVSINQGAE